MTVRFQLGLGALVIAGVVLPNQAAATASAELYSTRAYVYGRFEARIRYAAGDGVISSFFLWKEGSEKANTFWNELDFEKLNADCHMQTNAIYGNPSTQHSQTNAMPGDICAGYHDYRYEWTPTYIAWSVDGKEIRRDTGATATAFSQNATDGMTFHFNIWPGNADFGGNFSPSILPVREYISWVQYSAYNNGDFQLAWREEFDGGSLPSNWAVGNWASPYNLSTHSTANVSFVNGIAILSLTSDQATGFTGTPPADSGASGGTGGTSSGGTSASSSSTLGGGSSIGGTSAATGGTRPSAGGSSAVSGSSKPFGGSSNTGSTNVGGTLASGGAQSAGGSAPTGGTIAVGSGGIAATVASTSTGSKIPGSGGAATISSTRTSSTSTSSTMNAGGTSATSGGSATQDTQLSIGGGSATTNPRGGTSAASSSSANAPPPNGESGCDCRLGATPAHARYSIVLGLLGTLLMRWRRLGSRNRSDSHRTNKI